MLDLPLPELEELSKEEKIVKIFKDAIVEANNDDWNIELFSPEEEKHFIAEFSRKEGERRGERKGVIRGKRVRTIEIAKKLLAKNADIDLIMEVTNLSKKEIENI